TAWVVSGEFDAHGLARRDAHGVLERRVLTGTLQHTEEVTVQVHRMPHRRLIAQFNLHPVPLAYHQWIRLRIDLPVDHPHISAHVALQRERKRPDSPLRKRGWDKGAQVTV